MQKRIKSRSNASSVSQRIRGWFLDVNMEARQQLAIPGIQPLSQFMGGADLGQRWLKLIESGIEGSGIGVGFGFETG